MFKAASATQPLQPTAKLVLSSHPDKKKDKLGFKLLRCEAGVTSPSAAKDHHMVVIIDSSNEAAGLLDAAKIASAQLFTALATDAKTNMSYSVISCGSATKLEASRTDAITAWDKINALKSAGQTEFYTAIRQVAQVVDQKNVINSSVVVFANSKSLAAETDAKSLATAMAQTKEACGGVLPPFFVIGVGHGFKLPLKDLAVKSGGLYDYAKTKADLQLIMERLAPILKIPHVPITAARVAGSDTEALLHHLTNVELNGTVSQVIELSPADCLVFAKPYFEFTYGVGANQTKHRSYNLSHCAEDPTAIITYITTEMNACLASGPMSDLPLEIRDAFKNLLALLPDVPASGIDFYQALRARLKMLIKTNMSELSIAAVGSFETFKLHHPISAELYLSTQPAPMNLNAQASPGTNANNGGADMKAPVTNMFGKNGVAVEGVVAAPAVPSRVDLLEDVKNYLTVILGFSADAILAAWFQQVILEDFSPHQYPDMIVIRCQDDEVQKKIQRGLKAILGSNTSITCNDPQENCYLVTIHKSTIQHVWSTLSNIIEMRQAASSAPAVTNGF